VHDCGDHLEIMLQAVRTGPEHAYVHEHSAGLSKNQPELIAKQYCCIALQSYTHIMPRVLALLISSLTEFGALHAGKGKLLWRLRLPNQNASQNILQNS